MADKPSQPGQEAKNLSPKQLAAQARAETEAAERRRERMIRTVGAIVVLLVVGGLLAAGFFAGRSKDQAAAGPTPDANAPAPASAQADTLGIPSGTGWTAGNADKLPTLEIWEDFQCPACAQVEAIAGASILALANEGKVKLLWRPTTFLDANLPQSNNSSARATAAFGCAVDAGKGDAYHSGIFAMQPSEEGAGWTDQQLLDLGSQVGIEGEALDTFNKCVADGTYLSWAANSTLKFQEAGVSGTPTGYLNGEELSSSDLANVEALAAKIEAATQK